MPGTNVIDEVGCQTLAAPNHRYSISPTHLGMHSLASLGAGLGVGLGVGIGRLSPLTPHTPQAPSPESLDPQHPYGPYGPHRAKGGKLHALIYM